MSAPEPCGQEAPLSSDEIRLLGRWKTDTMLRYLHLQAVPACDTTPWRCYDMDNTQLTPPWQCLLPLSRLQPPLQHQKKTKNNSLLLASTFPRFAPSHLLRVPSTLAEVAVLVGTRDTARVTGISKTRLPHHQSFLPA
jgi:hypothetical protein